MVLKLIQYYILICKFNSKRLNTIVHPNKYIIYNQTLSLELVFHMDLEPEHVLIISLKS